MNLSQALDFEVPIVKQAAQAPRIDDLQTYVTVASAIMKTAYDLEGRPDHPTAELYSRMMVESNPGEGHQKLAEVVYYVLGKIALRRDAIEKMAAFSFADIWGLSRGAAGGVKNTAAPALQTLALLGIGGGGLAGAGIWASRRALSGEDQKSREMEIQRDTYRKLTAEVEEELKRRNLKNTPSNVAAAVDYLT